MTTPAPSPEAVDLDAPHALGCECADCVTFWAFWWDRHVWMRGQEGV